MNELFAILYENGLNIYHVDYSLIYQTLKDSNSYFLFGLVFLATPFILFSIFYFLWEYPYGKPWHWFVWLLIVSILTGIITLVMVNNEIFFSSSKQLNEVLANSQSGYKDFANELLLKYAAWNSLFGAILGSLYSLILKQFSKIQIHLPF